VLIAGSSFPYIEFMPKPGKARGVQIDIDPRRIGLRYPVEVGLVGDCRHTLDELLPLLQRKDDREFLANNTGTTSIKLLQGGAPRRERFCHPRNPHLPTLRQLVRTLPARVGCR
jgi:thiamine pyrophosphate-dependent acetolactate synthase large subunit-like protein